MFLVSAETLDTTALARQMEEPRAGALVVFEGLVRNHNEGLAVRSLEYECFEALAHSEAERILQEARSQFPIYDIICAHRVGHLAIGDTAVWVGVSSAHRDAGFQACRYVIDQIKVRLPIWKKEHYVNGDSEWVNCQQCADHGHQHKHKTNDLELQSRFYSRQSALPQIAEAGQAKLKQARVLVIGAGGLGCPALMYLAAAGVGTIGICDGDRVDISNLHRQTLYTMEDIGLFKARQAKLRLEANHPWSDIRVYTEAVDFENIQRLMEHYDVILDCTDNFVAKFLIHDACFLADKILIQASVYQFEGQLQLYDWQNGCLRCLWPELPDPSCIGSCTEAGVLGVVPGLLGTWQASEALKYILNLPGQLNQKTLLVNLMDNQTLSIGRQKNDACPLCSQQARIKSIEPQHYQVAVNTEREVTVKDALENSHHYQWIDIRQHSETYPADIKVLHRFADTVAELGEIPANQPVLIVCQKGIRSLKLVKELRAAGYLDSYSLQGGFEALNSFSQTVLLKP